MSKERISIWDTPPQLNTTHINNYESSLSDFHQRSIISTNNTWTNHTDYNHEKKTQRRQRYCSWPSWCSCCIQGCLIGSLLAGLALGIVIALWLTSKKTTSTSISTVQVTSLSSTNMSSPIVTTSISPTSTTSTAAPTCATWLWNTTGETVAGIVGVAGNANNQLNEPWNIYVDPTNNILYIADSQNHRIQKWLPGASTGVTLVGTGLQGSTSMLLNTPKDIFVDSFQNLYVADTANQRIQYFPNGSTTGITLSSSWSSIGSLWGVQLVNNSIYACDNTKSAVWANGSVVAGNQGTGSAANQLNLPQGFAVDTSVNSGTVYVVNSQQHTIVQWAVGASTGTIVAGVNGNAGSTSTLLKYPVSIKLDSYTNMFVVDNNNHRIQLFCRYPTINTTARTIAGTGTSGQTPQTFQYPAGVALDASLNLYVSDTSNHRVQKFQRLQ